jgi:hypothetical protein
MYQQNLWDSLKYEACEWNIWGNPCLGMGPVLTSNGIITLGSPKYGPHSDIEVLVIDGDLNIDMDIAEVQDSQRFLSHSFSNLMQGQFFGSTSSIAPGIISKRIL